MDEGTWFDLDIQSRDERVDEERWFDVVRSRGAGWAPRRRTGVRCLGADIIGSAVLQGDASHRTPVQSILLASAVSRHLLSTPVR